MQRSWLPTLPSLTYRKRSGAEHRSQRAPAGGRCEPARRWTGFRSLPVRARCSPSSCRHSTVGSGTAGGGRLRQGGLGVDREPAVLRMLLAEVVTWANVVPFVVEDFQEDRGGDKELLAVQFPAEPADKAGNGPYGVVHRKRLLVLRSGVVTEPIAQKPLSSSRTRPNLPSSRPHHTTCTARRQGGEHASEQNLFTNSRIAAQEATRSGHNGEVK